MKFLDPILAPIERVLFYVLQTLYSFVGDWGLAIILLTVVVRVVLIPLTWKQTKSMYEMQRIQPKLKELQEKYKNDKEKQQEEILKFYQEHKVNPLGGCLPLLLQMPIFFALYRVLGNVGKEPGMMLQYVAKAKTTASFYFIIPDIAKTSQQVFTAALSPGVAGFLGAVWVALPYLVLAVLFSLSIWIPQALMPGERQQKMIGAYMAIFMLYFGWVSPAGVLLYWVTSSIWGLAQQQLTVKAMQTQPVLAGAAAGGIGGAKADDSVHTSDDAGGAKDESMEASVKPKRKKKKRK